jgi:hypothetical protein
MIELGHKRLLCAGHGLNAIRSLSHYQDVWLRIQQCAQSSAYHMMIISN